MRLPALALFLAGTTVLVATPAEGTFPGPNGDIVFTSNRAENLTAEIYAIDVDRPNRRRNLSRTPGGDDSPVPSPDGSKVLFRSVRDNYRGIWIMSADGTGQRFVAPGDGPSWSPDGTRIAFSSRSGLSVMRLDTGETRSLGDGVLPAWSRDGTRIAFYRSERGQRLFVVNADGTGERRVSAELALSGPLTRPPSWSPDGERLTFSGGPPDYTGIPENPRIYVADLRNGAVRRLTADTVWESDPRWSPNTEAIAFVRYRPRVHIVVADALSGRTRFRTQPPRGGEDGVPNWSPDGRRIAFGRGLTPDIASQVYVIGANGRGLRRVTNEPPHSRLTSYSPHAWLDAVSIVYSSTTVDNDFDLYSVSTNGKVRRLTNDAVQDADPSWSPDGSRIAFVRTLASGSGSRQVPNEEIYVMRADGRGVRRLTRYRFEDASPTWSPDGSLLAFVRNVRGRGVGIFVMRADGTRVRRLIGRVALSFQIAWSPDGKWIAFTASDVGEGEDAGLFVVRADGSRVRHLPVPFDNVAAPTWSPGGRISFIAAMPCGRYCERYSAHAMRVDGTRLRTLADDVLSFDWSPDGTKLTAARDGIVVLDRAGHFRRRLTGPHGYVTVDSGPNWQPRCTIQGTARGDRIRGRARSELLCGLAGADVIAGGLGRDRLFGAGGNDRLHSRDRAFDVVGCGSGRDEVIADRADLVGVDCEDISRS